MSRIFLWRLAPGPYPMSRETFQMDEMEHESFMESTKSMVLLGTSKWFAKIIVKGRFAVV
jgi:hypothetical protein